MKLSKAIEILLTHQAELALTQTPDLNDSIYLGIEALKRLKIARVGSTRADIIKLPGETEA